MLSFGAVGVGQADFFTQQQRPTTCRSPLAIADQLTSEAKCSVKVAFWVESEATSAFSMCQLP